MNTLAAVRNTFGISARECALLVGCAALSFAFCIALFLPAVQDTLVMLGERLLQRPLDRLMWSGRLSTMGVFGGILHCVFFFALFYPESLPTAHTDKKAHKLVAAFLLVCTFVIMFRADWTFGDDYDYLTTTAVGKYYSPSSAIFAGRFFPLGHAHYNIPLFFFRLLGYDSGLPVEAHFAVIALFYAVTVVCLYMLFNKIEPVHNVRHQMMTVFSACTFIFLAKAFSDIFMMLIYPETQVVMLFSVFMLMYYMALATDKTKYYIIAMLAAVYATYCKEPVFGVFFIIVMTNCLFKLNIASKKEKIFYAVLILNGIFFLIAYYFLSFKDAQAYYHLRYTSFVRWKFITSVFAGNPALLLGFFICFIRVFYVIVKRERCALYYDSLLFAGAGYVLAYIWLGMRGLYYFTPAIILFLPSFVYWAKYLYQKRKKYSLLYLYVIIIIYTYNGMMAHNITDILHERKESAEYFTRLLADYHQGKEFIWYERENILQGTTFYGAAAVRQWRKSVANAFLNYADKTEGHDFFVVRKEADAVEFHKDILFFYPLEEDQPQPMPERLVGKLAENRFELYKNAYGVLVYTRR